MKIFMTGGAGFLGRAILKSAKSRFPDSQFTIFSRDEGKHEKLKLLYPQHNFILGDVRDYNALFLAMAGHDVVIHAAAMKYVPEGEKNVLESHIVNVQGSINVAQAASRLGLKRAIAISTDKACQPVNVYGITKLLMERAWQEYALKSDTVFVCTRYGNVVGSTGSVIPLFRRQARENRHIRLTNPQMTRFWLSVEHAVGLIDACFGTETGTVLIPRLPSITLKDMAMAAIKLELPYEWAKVNIEIVGQRFGEKVDESLVSDVEAAYTVNNPSGGTMTMYPVVHGTREDHIKEGYHSSKPDRLLTEEEMRQLIEESDD